MKFLGILPNMVKNTTFQKENLQTLIRSCGALLIPMRQDHTHFAFIKETTAIPEAQAAGVPLWKLGRSSGAAAWAQIRPVFDTLAHHMQLNQEESPHV